MKNVTEWSLQFDQLYNNITSNQAPGLTEYEKSVFLTNAQESVVVKLYNGSLPASFEATEELTSYLDALVKQEECTEDYSCTKVVPESKVYSLPNDLLFRTLELCYINVPGCGEMLADVVPITQDEYWRTSRNPFKNANERRVLRLSFADAVSTADNMYYSGYSELISKYDISKYIVRYISRPEPIILVDLDDDLSINGATKANTCKLNEHLHQTILAEAVKMAKAVWVA